MSLKSYRDLDVWSKSMTLAKAIYAAADIMPKREEYRLTSQIIRAAISIPANIAEGHARSTRKDYAHFISMARGSTAELETLLLLAGQRSCCLERRQESCYLLPRKSVECLRAFANA